MFEEKKNYRVILVTSDPGNSQNEISRTEFELVPVLGTELWQPKVSVYNQKTGFRFATDFPRGTYADLRAKLEKFSIRNGLDMVVKGLTHLSSLIGDKSSK